MKKFFYILLLSLLSNAAFAQQSIYIQVEGIKGESKDKNHAEWIDALAFSGGSSISVSTSTGSGGASAGKASVQDYTFSICLDKSTNPLRMANLQGTHIPKVTIEIEKPGATPFVYYKIELEDVLVSSISEGGSSGENKVFVNVSFNFARYKNTYFQQTPNGNIVIANFSNFDIQQNKAP